MTNSLKNRNEILQDRFALKTTSYLSAGTADLPYDISERLRAARTQAVAQRKITKVQVANLASSNGASTSLTLGSGFGDGLSWWARAGSFVPLITLVFGLLVINSVQSDKRVQELAEVDAALLIDALPPAAFADPGFVQFLKNTR